jgi:hypothetical protein
MSRETIQKKQLRNERQQEELRKQNVQFQRIVDDFVYVNQQERQQDEQRLFMFRNELELAFFDQLNDERQSQERNFFQIVEEGEQLFKKEKQALERESESLYEELKDTYKEEVDKNGKDGCQ